MLYKIFQTTNHWEGLILRVILGIVLFAHGAQKLFGWFDGPGFEASMAYLMDDAGLPWIIAFLTILLESIGSLLLILGLGTRIIAISFALLGIGIVLTTHLQYGFYMNWYGDKAGEGYEYFLLWIGMALALFASGGGRYALDSLILRNKRTLS